MSIAAAQATLDVVRDEGLIDNARVIGDYLLEQLPSIDGRPGGARRPDSSSARASQTRTVALGAVNGLKSGTSCSANRGGTTTCSRFARRWCSSRADADRLLEGLARGAGVSNLEKDPAEVEL